jgi:type III secretion system HrpE/YscL family protein
VSRVIKRAGAPQDERAEPQRSSLITKPELDAREAAQVIVDDARREAAELLHTAETEAERLRARAEERGFEQGAARAAELITRFAGEREAWIAAREPEVLDLALACAAKIIGREVASSDAAVRIVSQALFAARRARAARIRIAPADAEQIRANEASLSRQLTAGASLEIVEDPGVTSGGCIIETPSGRIDGRIETQLAAIRLALFGDTKAQP